VDVDMSQSNGPSTILQQQPTVTNSNQTLFYQSLTPPPQQQQSTQAGFYSTAPSLDSDIYNHVSLTLDDYVNVKLQP